MIAGFELEFHIEHGLNQRRLTNARLPDAQQVELKPQVLEIFPSLESLDKVNGFMRLQKKEEMSTLVRWPWRPADGEGYRNRRDPAIWAFSLNSQIPFPNSPVWPTEEEPLLEPAVEPAKTNSFTPSFNKIIERGSWSAASNTYFWKICISHVYTYCCNSIAKHVTFCSPTDLGPLGISVIFYIFWVR